MRGRELIGESKTPDGESLTLGIEDGDFVVRVRGEVLMSSGVHGSERAMAGAADESMSRGGRRRVLVAGLGMGFTLRAVLDRCGPRDRVTVVELLDDVVAWNRGPLAHLAGRPLDDPRVAVEIADLASYVTAGGGAAFDAILLDVDNGPEAFTVARNDDLYAEAGLRRMLARLAPGGVLVVWSAFASRAFERRLRRAGFEARSVTTRARPDVGKGSRHWLFVARRPR